MVRARERQRAKMGLRKRYTKTLSYRLEEEARKLKTKPTRKAG
jgi:hypothetical protein